MPRGVEAHPATIRNEDISSALSSADFYSSTGDFYQITPGTSVQETWYSETYPSEWLPSLKNLFRDVDYLIGDQHGNRKRRDSAIEYVDWLRDRTEPDQYSGNKEYSKGQATARLFLDSISLIARHKNYHSDVASKGRHSRETYQDILDLLEVKRSSKRDISSYARLNKDSPDAVVFNNILSIMNHARRLIYGDKTISEHANNENRRNLIGLLAENKVVEALQYGKWPLADHASAKLDSEGADVVVPIGVFPRHAVVLQVKSSVARGGQFQITPNHRMHMVVVPMNPETNNPFKLSEDGIAQLNNFVYKAPRMKLPVAA